MLDETDSGLDIDALRVVSEGVNSLSGPDLGVLLITHYQRLLDYIKPHFVHVFYNGQIVLSGGPSWRWSWRPGLRLDSPEFGEPMVGQEVG